MRAERVMQILMTAGFLVFCFGPFIAENLSLGTQTEEMVRAAENRAMGEKPDLSLSRLRYTIIKQLPGNLERYCLDRFPYRLELFDRLSSFQPPSVASRNGKGLFGKNHWLYLNDDSVGNHNTVDDFLGNKNSPEKKFQSLFDILETKRRAYDALGIKYYVLIAPNKVTVYPEQLLDPLPAAKGETDRERYMRFYRKRIADDRTPDFIVDLTEALIRAKEEYGLLYFPQDTHWNWMGRILAGRMLCDRIREDFPEVGTMPEISMEPGTAWTDLAPMLGAKATPDTALFPVREQWEAIEIREDAVPGIGGRVLFDHYLNPEGKLDAFFGGDSFMMGYRPLPEALVFRNAYFAPTAHGNRSSMGRIHDLILQKRPAIVVEEIVERNLLTYALPEGM